MALFNGDTFVGRRTPAAPDPVRPRPRGSRTSYGASADLAVAVQCRGVNENVGQDRGVWCHRPTKHASGYCPMHRSQWIRPAS